MKSVTVPMVDHLAGDVTSLCTCWKIERTDGETLAFTDHDEDLTIDSVVYSSSGGYARSALSTDAALSVDNLDVDGIIDSDFITLEDLRNGLYDYASVEMFMVNWADLTMGKIRLRRGWFGECNQTPNGAFKVELRGLTSLLANNAGEYFTPECQADLGDIRCTVVLNGTIRAKHKTYRLADVVRPAQVLGQVFATDAPIVNSDFEQYEQLGYTATIPGWSTEQGSFRVMPLDTAVLAENGSTWIEGYDQHNTASQTWPISALNFPLADVDAEQLNFATSSQHISRETNSYSQFSVSFLDAEQRQLSKTSTGPVQIPQLNIWYPKTLAGIVPKNTRYVKLSLDFHKDYPNSSVDYYVRSGIDHVTMTFEHQDVAVSNDQRFGNIVYTALNTGVSGGADDPGFTNTFGEVVQDGSVQWKASYAPFAATVPVQSVTSRRLFQLDQAVMGTKFADGLFNDGVLVFETGLNRGKRIEVDTYTRDTQTIALQYVPAYPVLPGDIVTITAGCQKDVDTCVMRFNNISNFRGFPHVPGNEFFYTSAQTGSD